EYGFDALVATTGAAPVRLPGPGVQRVLRTFDDAAALRSALRPGVKLAVVGAGWIGAELATSAAKRGCEVTVLEAAPAPLAGALGGAARARAVAREPAAGGGLRPGHPGGTGGGRGDPPPPARRAVGGRGGGGEGGGRAAGGGVGGGIGEGAGERGGGRRGAARLGPRYLRSRGLRCVLVPPLRRPDPGRALGLRDPRPGGGGG